MLQDFLRIWEMCKGMDRALLARMLILTASAIGAGIAMTGGLGPAVGIGYATGAASEASAKYPESRSNVISTMILGSAIASSTGIYSLVIALILLYANPLLSQINM